MSCRSPAGQRGVTGPQTGRMKWKNKTLKAGGPADQTQTQKSLLLPGGTTV